MVEFKAVTAHSRDKALESLNNDPYMQGKRIISISEESGSYQVTPRLDNSDTWYTETWFTLKVYFE